ncbi:MAG: hypothetical protein FWC41_12535 [Firmicutes bacterium]|nr:hypothetical protein [Bacillota bacterium]
MREIFEYLYKKCDWLKITNDRISFCFGIYSFQYDVVFEFLECIDLDDDMLDKFNDNLPIEELDFSLFSNNLVECVLLRGYTNIEEEDGEDGDKGHYENENSITYFSFQTLKKINKNYPNAILDYNIGSLYIEDSCEGLGCPDNSWDYGFEIQINKKYCENIEFYSSVIEIDKNLPDLSIPKFYNTKKELKHTFEINTLNSNTKTRRLGYLKILLKMLSEQKVPISKINSKFEKYCQDYNQYLEVHKNKKGNVIITKTGNSANPYIELAVSLGLIHKSAGGYEVGKIGKVYNILKDKIDDQNINPFVLSNFDTTFFLELLLKEDYWFLYAIMEQAAINPTISYSKLRKEFKQILLKQIGQFIDEAQIDNKEKVIPLKIVERRINEWKKSEVYMEHVLMPRLNWLYDMELIELRDDLSFSFTEIGERLFYNLSVWNDIALNQIVSPNAYIDNYFMKIINFAFDLQKQKYTKKANDEFVKCLEDSFVLFKTLAPNRITFSLFANYTKQMLFWKYSEIIDTENIKNIFEKKQQPDYIYKYQEHYKDGYIQKNKSICVNLINFN